MIGSQEDKKSKNKRILIFESSYVLAEHLFKCWIEIAQESVSRSQRFTVALPGGRSPMEFYCKLSNFKDFDLWKKTHIFLGDERFVPLDDENSNFKMIKKNLIDYINIPPENVHPIGTNQKNVNLSAEQYKNELIEFFDIQETNAPCFDLIVLGIGTDGHTAGLFPDDENITDSKRLVLPVSLPHLKQERVSMTFPVINNARNVIMPVLGSNKSGIIKEVIENKGNLPASLVDLTNGQLTLLLDKEAAQQLSYQDSYANEGQAILYDHGI